MRAIRPGFLLLCAAALAACTGPGGPANPVQAGPGSLAAGDPAATATPATPQAVSPAGEAVTIGFNNATQVVTTADGQTHYIWVQAGRLVHASKAGDGPPVTTVIDADGRPTLAALAAAGDVLVAGWTEASVGAPAVYTSTSRDGGLTWTGPAVLGAGTGVSLASDGVSVVAAWHVGDESAAEVHFARLDLASGAWSTPVRVDMSGAAPLWAAAAVSDEEVWVTWRDNRDGRYSVYLRRSRDGGQTWLPEQHLVDEVSGDPSVCAGSNGIVWVAYHGRGSTFVRRSVDGGETFGAAATVGRGWFARISCAADGSMAVGWEQSFGPDPKSSAVKSAVVVTADAAGSFSAPIVISAAAGTTASVTVRPDGDVDVVWVDRSDVLAATAPTAGRLYHAVVLM